MSFDLEKPESGEFVKKLAGIQHFSFLSIFKLKLHELSVIDLFTFLLSLAVIAPYIYILATNQQPTETYDTIAKLVIGAYIGRIIKKD